MHNNHVEEQLGGAHEQGRGATCLSEVYEVPLLNERGKTHGNWGVNADFAQRMKHLLRDTPNWGEVLTRPQQEALDHICTKIGRILFGDPSFEEHWIDIEGYARLGRAKD